MNSGRAEDNFTLRLYGWYDVRSYARKMYALLPSVLTQICSTLRRRSYAGHTYNHSQRLDRMANVYVFEKGCRPPNRKNVH